MKHLENSQFGVGRAGHDPATYGLKGPQSFSHWARVFRDGIASSVTRSLRVDRAPLPSPPDSNEDLLEQLRQTVGP